MYLLQGLFFLQGSFPSGSKPSDYYYLYGGVLRTQQRTDPWDKVFTV